MISKKKMATSAVATFGAALSSMYVAPELQADILDITWNGGNLFATNPFFSGSGTPISQNIDQVAGSFEFAQWNDTFGGSGRTMLLRPGFVGFSVVGYSQNLDPNTFFPQSGALGGGTQFDGTGTAYIGFRSAAGNVGWFHMSFTSRGPIIYGQGEYGAGGEAVHVGGTAIPEPSALGALAALAVGAASMRRKRHN
jgi:hypothetical protein